MPDRKVTEKIQRNCGVIYWLIVDLTQDLEPMELKDKWFLKDPSQLTVKERSRKASEHIWLSQILKISAHRLIHISWKDFWETESEWFLIIMPDIKEIVLLSKEYQI